MTAYRRTARIAACAVIVSLPLARIARAQETVSIPVTLSGEVRTRGEWDQPGGVVHADFYTYLRTRLGVRVTPVKGVTLVAQAQDSRVFGAESNTTTTNPDIIELHQAYLDVAGSWLGNELVARVGRQDVAFGNERLIGSADWTNTARSFDGIRLLWTQGNAKPGSELWTATAFGATVEARDRKFGALTGGTAPSDTLPNHNVGGIYATRRIGGGMLEGTIVLDGGMHYRSYTQANRVTFDARARQSFGGAIGFDVEGAWQIGGQTFGTGATLLSQDVNAWLIGAKLTRPAAPDRHVSGAIGVDVLSGDANAADGTYGAFNTMFATNHPFYGLMDLFLDPAARTNDHGLVDALATSNVVITRRASLHAELHHFAPEVGAGGEIGWEGDVVVPLKISGVVALDLGYTAFRAGPAAAAMGLGVNNAWRQWSYVQLRASF